MSHKFFSLATLAIAVTALALAVQIRTDLDGWSRAFVAWSKGA